MPRLGSLGWKKFNGGDIQNAINFVDLSASSTEIITAKVTGDSYPRAKMLANASYYFGSGAGGPDIQISRLSSNLARIFDKFVMDGLAASYSAAGNTLGNLVKKLEIYDENGDSLGFIPIYDAITQV